MFSVHWAGSSDNLTRFDADALTRSRLVAFATPAIVPPHMLDTLGYDAYNFHPGPLDISKEELDRRLRVFGGNHWGVSPGVNLHGIELRAVIG
jgi:hypothetical protein